MVSLLPAVHCLLVVLPRLEEHHIDSPRVGEVLELVVLLADGMADVGWRDAQSVESSDFRCLYVQKEKKQERESRSEWRVREERWIALTERYQSLYWDLMRALASAKLAEARVARASLAGIVDIDSDEGVMDDDEEVVRTVANSEQMIGPTFETPLVHPDSAGLRSVVLSSLFS